MSWANFGEWWKSNGAHGHSISCETDVAKGRFGIRVCQRKHAEDASQSSHVVASAFDLDMETVVHYCIRVFIHVQLDIHATSMHIHCTHVYIFTQAYAYAKREYVQKYNRHGYCTTRTNIQTYTHTYCTTHTGLYKHNLYPAVGLERPGEEVKVR